MKKTIQNSANTIFRLFFITIFIFHINLIKSQSAPMGATFTNSTATACWGTSSTTNECLTKTFTVSGIGTLSSTNVLNSISINMGGAGCQTDIRTYDISLIAPGGTTLNFITNISTTSTSGWINTTFVDNASLERIASYSTTVQGNYNPWSIGYYAPDVIGSFASTFNGVNADGTWTIQICEQSSGTSSCNACGSGSNLSFNSASITFGPAVPTYNATSTNLNDCAQAQCIDNTTLITASNNGYANGDALYPGNSFDGCSWNGANNNSAWFKFTPTGTTAQIVLSGIQAATTGSSDTQPIILENTLGNGCPSSITDWNVPTGGCADNESINNAAYLTTPNGGGITTSGNVYSNGITANTEFNLSSLTPNKTYYLLVDGNGGAASTFMVQMNTSGAGEGVNGAVSCNIFLPVEFLNFETNLENQKTLIYWSTASERNNLKFIVERSKDYINWHEIDEIMGAINSTSEQIYSTYDFNPYNGINYYRIKQIDIDGKFSYSFVRSINTEKELLLSPNPNNGQFNLYGLDKNVDNEIAIYNLFGQKITEIKTNKTQEEINISEFENGVYYMIINQSKTLKFTKH